MHRFHLKSFAGNSSKDCQGKNVREANFACPLLMPSTKTQMNGTYMKSEVLQTYKSRRQSEVCKGSCQLAKMFHGNRDYEDVHGDRKAESGWS